MTLLWIILAFAGGCLAGLLIANLWRYQKSVTGREIAEEVLRRSEEARRQEVERVLEGVKASFGQLSLDALKKASDALREMARSERQVDRKELIEKKELIDQQLGSIAKELERAKNLMQDLERDRQKKFGELSEQLKAASEQTAGLTQTTEKLREALSSSRARGQWGERMAEDILRVAGFVENVNYVKQKAIEGIGSRPDFTFLLPRDLKLNMDVKFPLDNYQKYLEAESEAEREAFKKDFLRDVKARVKEITTRDYINPEQNTVDYVLLFIPNEQVYAFINEQDGALIEYGLDLKVVLCSPMTLFAVLAVIRQAVDNFTVERTSGEILALLGKFHKQWEEFVKKMEKLGQRIEQSRDEYEALITTRRRKLEGPLEKIEELRERRGIDRPEDEKADRALPGP